ncbi:MAG: hypothetical protein H0T84_00855 [Tatlockia sp.]|nr:hypothetical protein [Tatlockia sp.]
MSFLQKQIRYIVPPFKGMIIKCVEVLKDFKNHYLGFKYYLADVKFLDNKKIVLVVIIQGIKKEIQQFSPADIVKDDVFLSGFSSCDARTITYLSFYQYIVKDSYEIFIERQLLNKGETYFHLSNVTNDEYIPPISAKVLYQNYDLLVKLSKKDMINAISTAVQEQTIFDINSMN